MSFALPRSATVLENEIELLRGEGGLAPGLPPDPHLK